MYTARRGRVLSVLQRKEQGAESVLYTLAVRRTTLFRNQLMSTTYTYL
jgi:hypothetical protein